MERKVNPDPNIKKFQVLVEDKADVKGPGDVLVNEDTGFLIVPPDQSIIFWSKDGRGVSI